MKRKMGIKMLIVGLFVIASGMTFGQNLTPKKANHKLKTQGFFILKHEYKTTEFLAKVKGVRLKANDELEVREGIIVVPTNEADFVYVAVKIMKYPQPNGDMIFRSCDCTGGDGNCSITADAAGNYNCGGDSCCGMVTITHKKDGSLEVDR